MMWHEARKQEKKIRGMIVDYHKRAERRRDYYEKIKRDPTQFIQLHGRPCKIHLDPAVAAAGDSPANMMPWQGQLDNLIDRFDVRAHLDFIPEYVASPESETLSVEDRHANYERYRILVQNDFLGVPEEKFLHQLHLEEQYGTLGRSEPPPNPDKKKKNPGAAIGYNYDEDGSCSSNVVAPAMPVAAILNSIKTGNKEGKLDVDEGEKDDDEDDDNDSNSDIDFDLCVDVSKVGTQQAHEMNRCGLIYGMSGNDFFSFLTDDVEEQEALRLAREHEEEKAMFSGRKSRRERRAFREKKLVGRKISPPSYATRPSPTYDPYRKTPPKGSGSGRSKSRSQSRSRSNSPVNTGVITYITSFGDEEDASGSRPPQQSTIKTLPAVGNNKSAKVESKPTKTLSPPSSPVPSSGRGYRRRSHSRSRSLSRRRKRRSRSSSYSSSSSRSRSRRRSRSYSPKSRSRGKSSQSYSSRRRNYSSHSSSRSRSRSRRLSQGRSTKSRSNSPPKKKMASSDEPISSAPLPRYYGRRKAEDSSSSEFGESDPEDSTAVNTAEGSNPFASGSHSTSSHTSVNSSNKNSRSGFGNSRAPTKPIVTPTSSACAKLTPQERLKKKMQSLLNKQYKADKRAEKARLEKAEQERMDREEELREIAIKMRRRERQKRHRMRRDGNEDDESEAEDNQWDSYSSDSLTPPGTSPRRSPRRSPRKSPRRSPRRSPKRSPPRRSRSRSLSSEPPHHRWDQGNRGNGDKKIPKEERDESRRDDRCRREPPYRRPEASGPYRKEEPSKRDEVAHRRDGVAFAPTRSTDRRPEGQRPRDESYPRRPNPTNRRDDPYVQKRRPDDGKIDRNKYRMDVDD